MRLRILRVLLLAAAFGWVITLVGVFMSWSAATQALQGLGAQPIHYDPMLDYWFRMGCGAFGLVGVWYLMLAIWPKWFSTAIPWFGIIMVVEGIILLVHGLRLSLPPFPFYADTAACLLLGGGIVYLSSAAK